MCQVGPPPISISYKQPGQIQRIAANPPFDAVFDGKFDGVARAEVESTPGLLWGLQDQRLVDYVRTGDAKLLQAAGLTVEKLGDDGLGFTTLISGTSPSGESVHEGISVKDGREVTLYWYNSHPMPQTNMHTGQSLLGTFESAGGGYHITPTEERIELMPPPATNPQPG